MARVTPRRASQAWPPGSAKVRPRFAASIIVSLAMALHAHVEEVGPGEPPGGVEAERLRLRGRRPVAELGRHDARPAGSLDALDHDLGRTRDAFDRLHEDLGR